MRSDEVIVKLPSEKLMEDKAAAFDWLEDKLFTQDYNLRGDHVLKMVDGTTYLGRSLLDCVNQAMDN